MYEIFHSGSAHPLKVRAGCFAEVEYLYPSPKKSWRRKDLNLCSGINIFRLQVQIFLYSYFLAGFLATSKRGPRGGGLQWTCCGS
jgi:hypothetical protein